MAKKSNSKKNKLSASGPVKTAKPATRVSPSVPDTKWPPLILLCFAGLFFLIGRVQLLAIPLERDEGSFAYIGHWLFRGKHLYTEMLDSKLPGLYTYYGFFTTLFGYNATGVHMGLFIANIISVICFYLFLKEIFNRFIAAVACAFYLFLVMSPNVYGFAAHATQLLTPFILGGFLLFWKGIQKNKLPLFLLSGLLIGIAFTIKQQSAIFGILIALLWWPARLWWNKREDGRIPILEWIALGVGGLLPAAAVYFYYWQVGRFDLFYDWTVTQPLNLAAAYRDPWYKMFYNVLPEVIRGFEATWITAVLGLVLIFFVKAKKFATTFGFAFAVLGFLSVIIGAAYYRHYFAVAMPGIALLTACTLYWISLRTGRSGTWIASGLGFILLLLSLRGKSDYYFNPDYAKIHYDCYGQNMFPEIEKLGKELKKRMPEGSRLAVMGSEPEALVAADKESCSKYLMVYAILFDPVRSPPMQQEYIQELQQCAPDYILWNTTTGSWANGYDKLAFFETLMQWVEQNYETIALAESRNAAPGVVIWDKELDTYQPLNNYKIFVLKKKAVAIN